MSRDTLHLLLLTHSQNEAENIISLLRNSGKATRAHFVESIEDFTEQLQDKSWDLLLAYPQVDDIRSADLFNQIKRLNKDLPVILINDEVNAALMEQSIRQGACTIVPKDETDLLLLVIQRELNHLRARRELRTMDIRFRDTEKRCQHLLQSSRDAIAYIHDGMHVFANQAYLDLFGYKNTDDLSGMPIMDMIESSAQQEFKRILRELQKNDSGSLSLKSKGVDGEGKAFDMALSFTPATYGDEECTQVSINLDSDNSELQEKIKEFSSRDLLTGLYNKPFFNSKLDEATTLAIRKGVTGSVFYINIDHFGKLRSEFGINCADTILCAVANKIKSLTSTTDILARTGEDIFCLLRLGIDADEALTLAEKIRDELEHLLIEVGDRTATLTVSIGVALISETSSRSDDILQNAHKASIALAVENKAPGNCVQLFVPEDTETDADKNDLNKELISAIKNNHLHLLFQPLLNIKGDTAEHYEVLLRLQTSKGEVLSGGDLFESQAIEDDVKRKVDRWVIIQATKALSSHQAKKPNTRLFINLSSASLTDDKLPNWLAVALNASGLPKGSIIFQFQEDDAIRTLKQTQDFTHALQEKGIPTAISRFGCALNPMQNLKRIAVTYVKLDSSFTQEMGSEVDIKHLNTLLEELHEEEKITIIPSVENAAAMASLWQTSVHYLQGYGIQAPQETMSFNFGNDEV